MSKFKRILATVLMIVMVLTVLPVHTLATEGNQATVENGDLTVQGTNGFGTLISQEISENQAESAEEGAAYEAGYTVTDLTFEGSLATVEYSSLEEAILVVALYSEDGLQMLASGTTTVEAEKTEAMVTIEGDMPEYFLASAYLMDTYDLSPLCAAYDTPMYTREMQELLASTVDDYDPDRVLNLDNDETTNFAVYAEDTIVIEGGNSVNTVTSVDDEKSIYIIKNANESITSLGEGNVFVYPYAEGEILIVKVASIEVEGTTATITGEELEVEEVFSHVKIEGTSDVANSTVQDGTGDEGVTYQGMGDFYAPFDSANDAAPANMVFSADDSYENDKTYTASHNFSFDVTLNSDKTSVKFSGGLRLKADITLGYYVSWTHQYLRFDTDLALNAFFGVTGSIDLYTHKLPNVNFDIIPGLISVGCHPELKVSFSGKIEWTGIIRFKVGFVCGHNVPYQDLCTGPWVESETKSEIKLSVVVDVRPTLSVKATDFLEIVSSSLTCPMGFELTASPNGGNMDGFYIEFGDEESSRHTCYSCLKIALAGSVELGAKVVFLGQETVDWLKIEIPFKTKVKADIGTAYYSNDYDEFGFGSCPHQSYRLTIQVLDENLNAVSDTAVGTSKDNWGTTNQHGIIATYVPSGIYKIATTVNGEEVTATVKVTGPDFVTISPERSYNSNPSGGNSGDSDESGNWWDDVDFGGVLGEEDSEEVTDHGVAIASGSCGDNLTWALYSDGTLTISGEGEMWDYDSYRYRLWHDYSDQITTVIIGDDVTTISDNAFDSCDHLISVAIPDSVTSIGYSAFEDCSRLASVTIPNSITSINGSAFESCSSLASVTIVSSVTTIGSRAFAYCDSLVEIIVDENNAYYSNDDRGVLFNKDQTELIQAPGAIAGAYEIPDSVTTIGVHAFSGCSSLTNVTIPDSVTTIGAYALSGCSELKIAGPIDGEYNIEFGWTESIPKNAFSGCSSLTSVTIPDSVTSIDSKAFYGCSSLTSVTIPYSVTTIGDEAFYGCNGLKTAGPIDGGYNIEFGWTESIPENAFYYCSSLTSVTIPNSVTTIGDDAFERCSSLTSLTIPDSVITIGDYAFSGCSSLTSVMIPDGVTFIGSNAFRNCSSLTSVTIPDSVISTELAAFHGCSGLKTAGPIDGGYNIEFGWTESIPGYAFSGCSSLTSVTIPNSVTTIGDNAFSGCSSLTSVTIPDSVTSIGSKAFYGCSSLTSVAISDSVTTIDWCAFSGCSGLKTAGPIDGGYNIEFGWTKSIPENAFYDCSSLTSVTIPDSITSIGNNAFNNCSSLVEIIVDESNTYYSNDDCGVLLNKDQTELIQAPGAIAGAYEISDSVTTIDDRAFEDCSNLTSVKIPDSVTTIGEYTFYGCNSLTSVTIPDSVITIGDNAFSGCSRLKTAGPIDGEYNIEFGWTESIPASAFEDCSSLTSVIIPDSITNIGHWTFSDCDNLASVTIGNGVTTIGSYAFYSCTSLTSVTIPDSVTTIGEWAFSSCGSLKSITFAGNAPKLCNRVFYYVTTTAYYPAGNATWSSDVMQDYGGTVTWVPYNSDRSSSMVTDESAAVTVTADPAELAQWVLYTSDGNSSMVTDESAVVTVAADPTERAQVELSQEHLSEKLHMDEDIWPDPEMGVNAVASYAIYPGDYDTEITDTYTLKTASFKDLVPGEQYVLLAMKSIEVDNPLAADNLLYIDQTAAGEDGTLSFQYVQRTPADTSYVVVCGASNKDLADAEITFPEMTADGEMQAVDPTVVYDSKTLTEGKDYTVIGTVSFTEAGTYTCYIRGVRQYTGLVSCTYTVEEPHVHTEVTVPGKTATCIETGLTEGKKCSVCDEVTVEQEEIPATGHTEETVAGKDATCTEAGLTDGKKCTVCGEVTVKQELIPATGKHLYSNDQDTDCDVCGFKREVESQIETIPMYRLYNPNSGEHHFTGSIEERDNLTSLGWHYEGIGWYAPIYEGEPVYRSFNPNSGDHHYTMSWEEVQNLVNVGWIYEGVAWNSAGADKTPQYRMYNPNADLGSHHYTSSIEERDFLVSLGWHWEGIGWFGYDAPA